MRESSARASDDEAKTSVTIESERERAREIALRMLNHSPRSGREVHDRLTSREVDEQVADEVVKRFSDVGLINDVEYAATLVRTRHDERGQARRAIAHELSRRGIDEVTAQGALSQIDDDDEAQRAREIVDRRLQSMTDVSDDRALRRLAGYLGRRGYPGPLAMRVIRDALDERRDGVI